MSIDLDIDDVAALEAHDPAGMLRAIASSGAQIRTALLTYDDAAATVARVRARIRARATSDTRSRPLADSKSGSSSEGD